MRYFIYKNEQILGPFSPQEMEQAEDLRSETLVCAETVSGRMESDWKSIEEISELSDLKFARLVDLTPKEGEEPGLMERLELETFSEPLPGKAPERVVSELFQDGNIQELSQAQGQVRELTAQIKALEGRLAKLQAERASFQASSAPLVPPSAEAKLKKEIKLEAPKTFRVVNKGLPSEKPLAETPAPAEAKPKKEIKLKAPKTLRVVNKAPEAETQPLSIESKAPESEPPPITLSVAQPMGPNAAAQPPAELAPEAESLQEPSLQAPAPVTSMFAPEETREPFPSTAPPLTISVSGAGPAMGFDRPLTVSPPAAPPPVPGMAPPPLPEPQEVLARLAKPVPAPSTAPVRAPKRRFFLFLMAGLSLLAGFLLWMFLRNSRDLKLLANMGADQKPLGEQPLETQAPLPQRPPDKSLEAAVAGPAPRDLGAEALKLVKDYPLDGDRGSVGQWLQYSFTANPGEANKEEWTAGAVESSVYLVQYRVLPGAQGKLKEPITYLFEADLSRKTVKASNPAARELMAGMPAPAPVVAPKPAPRARAKPRRQARRPQAKRRQGAPQLPLPSDMELLPPASEDGVPADKDVEPAL
ncbi:MAG: hypothetical protein HY921_06565 [Elusimicrobia bacterium]|nr:hypothetical protein [Elusimicrobiota bacterium]